MHIFRKIPERKEELKSDEISSDPAICFGKYYHNQCLDQLEAERVELDADKLKELILSAINNGEMFK